MSPFEEKAAQLKKLKELLDSGAITHEEFDEMKKEILEKGSTANWAKINLPKMSDSTRNLISRIKEPFKDNSRRTTAREPMPCFLKLTANPTAIFADGFSKSILNLSLLDEKRFPVRAPFDIIAGVSTSRGKIQQPTLTISRGQNSAQTTLTSSGKPGTVIVCATTENFGASSITLTFKIPIERELSLS